MKLLVTTLAALALAAPVSGQTLSERIALVKKERARQVAAARSEGLSSRASLLQVLLYKDLSVEFEQTPAREVFDFMRTALGINLIGRYSDDAAGHGIDPQTPITLAVESLPAIEVLGLVLEQCSSDEPCTWQLRDGFVELGTKERLSVPAARQTRWYPIDSLLFEAPDFDDAVSLRLDSAFPWSSNSNGGLRGAYGGYGGGTGGYGGSLSVSTGPSGGTSDKTRRAESLIALITELVEPDAWTVNGGVWASIHYREGALVIRAPEYIQRQIGGYPRVPPN